VHGWGHPTSVRDGGAESAPGSRTVMSVSPAARPPRFLPFILTGAVLGFLAGAVVSVGGWLEDPDPTIASNYGSSAGIGYLGFLGALLGGLLAALLAVLIDRRHDRA
jgi:presenilin-like A22 family membrane protease